MYNKSTRYKKFRYIFNISKTTVFQMRMEMVSLCVFQVFDENGDGKFFFCVCFRCLIRMEMVSLCVCFRC